MSKTFRFHSGRVIEVGDIVVLSGIRGVVESVFLPKTKHADDYGCLDSGGVLIHQPSGLGLVLIVDPEQDEDLIKCECSEEDQ